jgi:nickel-type superoxide dismutase maturation protease
MRDEVPVAGVLEWLRLLIGRRRGLMVDGESMLPTLRSGEKVLLDPRARIAVGDIVAADHPFKSKTRLIKRLVSIGPDGRIFLGGDNPAESTDSRSFGTISREQIIGKVVARI